MFNDYELVQIARLRMEETERNSRCTWMNYLNLKEKKAKKIASTSLTQAKPCCQCI